MTSKTLDKYLSAIMLVAELQLLFELHGNGFINRSTSMRASAGHLHLRSVRGCPSQPPLHSLRRLHSLKTNNMQCNALFECQSDKVKLQLVGAADDPISVHPILKNGLDGFFDGLDEPAAAAWAKVNKFNAKSGEVLLVPGANGAVSRVLLGINSWQDLWAYAALPGKLPPGDYKLALDHVEIAASEGASGPSRVSAANKALLGWILGKLGTRMLAGNQCTAQLISPR